MGKLMNDNFVVVHIDTQESDNKKNLENSGGEVFMKQWHGQGLPFMVVLDATGKVLINSNRDDKDGQNIGYPAKPEEIAHFMKMLKAGSAMSGSELAEIEGWLKAHAPPN